MKNILITGGAGFIGSNLALKLKENGYNITVLDNLSPQIHGENPDKTSPLYQNIKDVVNFVQGSVTVRNDWLKVIQNQHVIVHLAAETGTGQSMYEVEKYTAVNVGGTALMLDILTNTQHSVKKIIIASSRAIYGEGKYYCISCGIVYPQARKEEDLSKHDFDCKCPVCGKTVDLLATTEDSLIHPSSVYGVTKYTQEQLIMALCPNINISPVSLRYQNVYGAGQSLANPYTGILSIFSTRIKNGNSINIFEDGKETRDFIYIDDVVAATILAIEKNEANNHIFNVGTGKSTDVQTIANTLLNKYCSNAMSYISGNYRLGDIRHNIADISKIKSLLNFEPQYDFEKGIQKFVDWVNQQKIQNDNYDMSFKEMKNKGLLK